MAFLTVDPSRVRPQPGVVVVRIDEVLGGETSGGIFIPAGIADAQGRKDTASGIVLRAGPAPDLRHEKAGARHYTRPGRTLRSQTGTPWSPGAFPVQEGERVFFPRDVPLVFLWEDRRYGLICMDEIICVARAEDDVRIPERER